MIIMSKYAHISSLEELRAARKEIQIDIKLKEFELSRSFEEFKYLFNPIRIIGVVYSKFIIVEKIIDAAMKGYQFVKDYIAKKQSAQNSTTN